MEGNSHSGLDALLIYFVSLWLCTELALATHAGPQAANVCCSVTASGKPPETCGKCGDEECCADKACRECRLLPTCPEGEERWCSGTIEFRYYCRPCPNGTYSDTKNGCCSPWTNCKLLGREVLQPGNRTRNVICDKEPLTIVMQHDSTVTTILTAVTAGCLALLLLMTFFLLVCIWSHKKKFPLLVEEPDFIHPLNLQGSPQQRHKDTDSCQFPEEERGGKMAENMTSLNSLAR